MPGNGNGNEKELYVLITPTRAFTHLCRITKSNGLVDSANLSLLDKIKRYSLQCKFAANLLVQKSRMRAIINLLIEQIYLYYLFLLSNLFTLHMQLCLSYIIVVTTINHFAFRANRSFQNKFINFTKQIMCLFN